jgi:hypothetical protein
VVPFILIPPHKKESWTVISLVFHENEMIEQNLRKSQNDKDIQDGGQSWLFGPQSVFQILSLSSPESIIQSQTIQMLDKEMKKY